MQSPHAERSSFGFCPAEHASHTDWSDFATFPCSSHRAHGSVPRLASPGSQSVQSSSELHEDAPSWQAVPAAHLYGNAHTDEGYSTLLIVWPTMTAGARQSVHGAPPPPLNRPTGHASQLVPAWARKRPASQGTHMSAPRSPSRPPTPILPVGQKSQRSAPTHRARLAASLDEALDNDCVTLDVQASRPRLPNAPYGKHSNWAARSTHRRRASLAW